MELRVGRKYRLGKKIGSGSFGGAYSLTARPEMRSAAGWRPCYAPRGNVADGTAVGADQRLCSGVASRRELLSFRHRPPPLTNQCLPRRHLPGHECEHRRGGGHEAGEHEEQAPAAGVRGEAVQDPAGRGGHPVHPVVRHRDVPAGVVQRAGDGPAGLLAGGPVQPMWQAI